VDITPLTEELLRYFGYGTGLGEHIIVQQIINRHIQADYDRARSIIDDLTAQKQSKPLAYLKH
jgi:hypothetical protein